MLVSLFSSTAEEVAARSSITASHNKEKINKITSFFCELLCFHFFPQEHGAIIAERGFDRRSVFFPSVVRFVDSS